MSIDEGDVSVLIPTYRYRDKVVRAVRSALASGAGEIIVTDDCSGDGTMEALAAFRDPRLRVYENPRNLGLWENHLAALSRATRPWIKFVQADDFLLSGGLARFAAGASSGVAVVWAAPIVHDDETGETSLFHHLTRPLRLPPEAMFAALVRVGWILGSPSHMLLRADAVERDPAAWHSALSADLVVGAIAATRGDTVLLPPGAIAQGCHPGQDGRTEGAGSALARLCHSVEYLRGRPEPALSRFATLWTITTLRPATSAAMRCVAARPRAAGAPLGCLRRLLAGPSRADWAEAWAARREVARALRFRWTARPPFDLDGAADPARRVPATLVSA